MKIGTHQTFERKYMAKFQTIASEFGEFVEYKRDLAARDIGLHLTIPKADGGEIVSPALVWFQLKGIHATTLSAEDFELAKHIERRLETKHLRFWYIMPEPTYVVVYVEAVDRFFITNIQRYVSEEFGDQILTEKRKTISVKIAKESQLDSQAFSLLLRNHNLKAWQKRIHDDEDFAAVFFRDGNLIKHIGSAEERGVEIVFLLRKYGSKTRSEVYILERPIDGSGEEIGIHVHWHFFMPDPEAVFPYLYLTPDDKSEEEIDDYWNEDENPDWPPIELSSGKLVHPDGVFELVEYRMKAELNDLGQGWLQTLEIMEAAGFVEVDTKAKTFVSVAPWHTRDV